MCCCRYSDIRWEGEVIVLLGDVRISPPYLPEHCIGSSGVDRIKKLVYRFSSHTTISVLTLPPTYLVCTEYFD